MIGKEVTIEQKSHIERDAARARKVLDKLSSTSSYSEISAVYKCIKVSYEK